MSRPHQDPLHYITAKRGVRISGSKSIIGYPIIVAANCGVFTPAAEYIRHEAMWSSLAAGSLRDVAGIICDWCNHLSDIGVEWSSPTSLQFNSWVTDQVEAHGFSHARQIRKASVIFEWYRFMAMELNYSSVFGFAKSISDAHGLSEEIGKRVKYRRASASRLKNGRRPVPSTEQVQRVLEALMDHPDPFIAERNWLIGRTAYETGLRAMGNASLDLQFIDRLLRSKSILAPTQSVADRHTRALQAEVRRRLQQFRDFGFKRLYGTVLEKRSKNRTVGFPIDLVLAILDYVWGERAKVIRERGVREANGDQKLWIAASTGWGLNRGSICDIVACNGFKAAGVRGSGHSLRAAFLTEQALRLLAEARSKFGQNYDEFTILNELAELAGHENPDTLRYYIDQARLREFAFRMVSASAELGHYQ